MVRIGTWKGVLNGWIFTDWRWRYFYSYKWLWTNSWLGSNPFLRHKRQIFVLRSGWKSLGKLFQSSLLPPASWLRVWNKETFILSAFYGKLLLQILVSLYIFIFFSCFLFFQSRTGNPLTRPSHHIFWLIHKNVQPRSLGYSDLVLPILHFQHQSSWRR